MVGFLPEKINYLLFEEFLLYFAYLHDEAFLFCKDFEIYNLFFPPNYLILPIFLISMEQNERL